MFGKRDLLWLLSLIAVIAMVTAGCTVSVPGAPEAPASQPPAAEAPATGEEAAEPDLLDQVLANGVIRVSTDPNYAPQSLLRPDGTYEGFDIDVATEIAKRLGVEVEFVTPDWDVITAGQWGGQWDMSVGSMTITKPRTEVLYFTEAYYFAPAQLGARAGSDIETVEDIAGAPVCVGTATTYESYLRGEDIGIPEEFINTPPPPDVEVIPLSTDAECVQAIQAGRTEFDAFLTSGTVIDEAIAQGVNVVAVGEPVFVDNLAVAFDRSSSPDSLRLRDRVSEIINEMHADGTLSQLSEKWFGADLTQDPTGPN